LEGDIVNELRKFAVAWCLMWGLSYVVVAVVAPWISDVSNIVYTSLGVSILLSLVLSYRVHDRFGWIIIRMIFFAQGVLMVYGGVTSWTGLAVWNVPFNPEMFNVSMAFADLISATFFFVLALTEKVN
jgi:drug/metabolite transporter (DMT)-like permease